LFAASPKDRGLVSDADEQEDGAAAEINDTQNVAKQEHQTPSVTAAVKPNNKTNNDSDEEGEEEDDDDDDQQENELE